MTFVTCNQDLKYIPLTLSRDQREAFKDPQLPGSLEFGQKLKTILSEFAEKYPPPSLLCQSSMYGGEQREHKGIQKWCTWRLVEYLSLSWVIICRKVSLICTLIVGGKNAWGLSNPNESRFPVWWFGKTWMHVLLRIMTNSESLSSFELI